MGKYGKLDAALKQTRVLKNETKLRLQEQDTFFNIEHHGYLITETERERTLKVTQAELKENLPVQNANNIFDLRIPKFGP